MCRTTPRITAAALLAALALIAAPSPEAGAAASVQTYTYSTGGNISGMAGVQPIEFLGTSGSLTAPGSFILGTFRTSPLPATATLTYANTPFEVDVNVAPSGPGPGTSGSDARSYEYKILGALNGSVSGDGRSTMLASVTSITGADDGLGTAPPFPVSDLHVNVPQGIVAPFGDSSGISTLTAQVVVPGFPLPPPAPEPTSVAAFAVALIGLALRRKLRAGA